MTLGVVVFSALVLASLSNVVRETTNFYVITPSTTWQTWSLDHAQDICQGMGTEIGTVTSQSDNDEIMSVVNAHGITSNIWIGLDDVQFDNVWVWRSGYSDTTSYTNWADGEPDPDGAGYVGDDCTYINPSNGQWYDNACWTAFRAFVCDS